MDSETRKIYNATYYEKNRKRILEDLCQCSQCPFCLRNVTKSNLYRHQQSTLCVKTQERNMEHTRRMQML